MNNIKNIIYNHFQNPMWKDTNNVVYNEIHSNLDCFKIDKNQYFQIVRPIVQKLAEEVRNEKP